MTQVLPTKSELPLLLRAPAAFVARYWWALGMLMLGAAADVVTTLVNMRAYGPEVEAHLVQRWVSYVVGVNVGVPLAKLMQLTFVVLVAAWWRPWCAGILVTCGVLYMLAAVSNHLLLL